MKYGLIFGLLLASQLSFAQSLKEKRVKQEMLDRIDLMTTKIDETHGLLDKEDAEGACQNIKNLKEVSEAHLRAVGTNMDMSKSRVKKIEKESRVNYLYLDLQTKVCALGEGGENLDLTEATKNLRDIKKDLEKHRERITDLETNKNNAYEPQIKADVSEVVNKKTIKTYSVPSTHSYQRSYEFSYEYSY